jgi:hypothetical protein
MIMASYSDEHYVDFWRPLQRTEDVPPFHAFRNPAIDEQVIDDLDGFGVAQAMVQKAHRQVRQVHGLSRDGNDVVPPPIVGLGWDWSRAPYFGGWHSWNPHARSWEVMDRMVQPFVNIPVFVCGEAYSTEQGWAEGALRSAERILRRWNVALPTWLRSYDCQNVITYDQM